MTERDRIAILLHHYRDVCEGIPEGGPTPDDVIALMCREWNHPSYQQLERLLRVMAQRWPAHRAALRQRYERYDERRVAWCRRCGDWPAHHQGRIHSHPPGRAVTLVPRIVRVDSAAELHVSDAIDWLERHWRGEVDLPDTIIAHHTAVLLRAVAA